MASIGKLFTRGYTTVIQLGQNDHKTPPPNKAWLIIGGVIAHITGSTTQLSIHDVGGTNFFEQIVILASATASDTFPIFNVVTTGITHQAAWTMNIVQGNESLWCNGGTGSGATVKVVEFDTI